MGAESESGARRVLAFLPATPGDGLYSPGGVVSRFIFRVSTAKADYYTGHETRACAPVPARLQPRRASRDRMLGRLGKPTQSQNCHTDATLEVHATMNACPGAMLCVHNNEVLPGVDIRFSDRDDKISIYIFYLWTSVVVPAECPQPS